MKHTRLVLIFLTLLVISGSMMSCETATFMDPKDMEPKLFCTPLESSFGSAAGGSTSATQQYCVDLPVPSPKTQTNFQLVVQSYDINQPFEFFVYFPENIGFGAYETQIDSPLSSGSKEYTSDNGNGPGGFLTIGVAAWAPMVGTDPLAVANGSFTFKFVVKDQEGHTAAVEQNIMVLPVLCLE